MKRSLGVVTALGEMAAGRLSPWEYAETFIARIEECDHGIGAWQSFDAQKLRQDVADSSAGRLAGIPVGIKDNMDTVDHPTTYGSGIYSGHRPAWDAACVATIRQAGGLVMGKTVSTEFAYYKPGKTRNPHDPMRTPGGSSSGSAAAVAAGMAPLALGTQTAGSVIRPASYCGVVGYKPSFGWIARAGVKALADGLDTVGVFATNVPDAALLVEVLSGRSGLMPMGEAKGFRVGVCKTPVWPLAGDGTRQVFGRAAELISVAGEPVRDIDLPESFAGLSDAQKTIMAFESRHALAHEYRVHSNALSPQLLSLLEEGDALNNGTAVGAAYGLAAQCRLRFEAFMNDSDLDVLLVPSAVDEAPLGVEATGDPAFSRIWTLLGTPCVNVPGLVGPQGMPVGVQVVGRYGDDANVLAAAARIEAIFGAERE